MAENYDSLNDSRTHNWLGDSGGKELATASTNSPASNKSSTGVGGVLRIKVDPYQLAALGAIEDVDNTKPDGLQGGDSVTAPVRPRRMELINRFASDVEDNDSENLFSLENAKYENQKFTRAEPQEQIEQQSFELDNEPQSSHQLVKKSAYNVNGSQRTPKKGTIELEEETNDFQTDLAVNPEGIACRNTEEDPFSLDATQNDREPSEYDRCTNSVEREPATSKALPLIIEESELACEFEQSLQAFVGQDHITATYKFEGPSISTNFQAEPAHQNSGKSPYSHYESDPQLITYEQKISPSTPGEQLSHTIEQSTTKIEPLEANCVSQTLTNQEATKTAPPPITEPSSTDIADLDAYFDKNPLDLNTLPAVDVDLHDRLKDHQLEAELVKVEMQLKTDNSKAAKGIPVPNDLLKACLELRSRQRGEQIVSSILDLESMISQGSKLATLANSLRTPLQNLLGKRSPTDSPLSSQKNFDYGVPRISSYNLNSPSVTSYLEKIRSPIEKNLQSIADWEVRGSNPLANFSSTNRDWSILYAQDPSEEREGSPNTGKNSCKSVNSTGQRFGQNLFPNKPQNREPSFSAQLKAALSGKTIEVPRAKQQPASGGVVVGAEGPAKKKKYWMGPIPSPLAKEKETFSDNFKDATPNPKKYWPSAPTHPAVHRHHESGGNKTIVRVEQPPGNKLPKIEIPSVRMVHCPPKVLGPFEKLQQAYIEKDKKAVHVPEVTTTVLAPDAVVNLPPSKPMPGKGRVAH